MNLDTGTAMNSKPLFSERAICVALALAFAAPAHAVLGLNQIPPDAITPPVPNLIVTLDDSGSMAAVVPYDDSIVYQVPADRNGIPLPNRVSPRAYTDGFNATGDIDITTQTGYGAATDKTNFATWYSFYRTRNLSMKAAVYLAFADNVVPDGRIRQQALVHAETQSAPTRAITELISSIGSGLYQLLAIHHCAPRMTV
jgi:hypothetical protein